MLFDLKLNRTNAARLGNQNTHQRRYTPDGSDLLDHISRGVQVQQPLVDPHLKSVPRVGTLTSR